MHERGCGGGLGMHWICLKIEEEGMISWSDLLFLSHIIHISIRTNDSRGPSSYTVHAVHEWWYIDGFLLPPPPSRRRGTWKMELCTLWAAYNCLFIPSFPYTCHYQRDMADIFWEVCSAWLSEILSFFYLEKGKSLAFMGEQQFRRHREKKEEREENP